MVPHIPPKGLQMVRYAGLYARCVKRRWLEIANVALEAIRTQFPLFALDPFLKSVAPLKWRERIKASFGYDPQPARCAAAQWNLQKSGSQNAASSG